jgi:hypothetical protein
MDLAAVMGLVVEEMQNQDVGAVVAEHAIVIRILEA